MFVSRFLKFEIWETNFFDLLVSHINLAAQNDIKSNLKYMKKITFIGLVAFAIAVTTNVRAEEVAGFSGFEKKIFPREKQEKINSRALPVDPTVEIKSSAFRKPSRFVGWNEENPSANMRDASINPDQKMDSVVSVYMDGRLMSKQTFEYTETGRPLLCTNYVATLEDNKFQFDGHYRYEYDNQGRVTVAEKLSSTGSSVKMEYVYEGDNPVYSEQIAYIPGKRGEWTPYQKGEYEFDLNYNTTKETYYVWDSSSSEWVPVQKTEATYNDISYLTSYFPYVWDSASNVWVGDKSGAYEGQRFEYTQSGNDAWQKDYTWENDAWLEYKHINYTYNTSDLLTLKEDLYWNREKQDWSGGDGYGEWGDPKYNSRDVYEYDEYGRVILNNFYRLKKTVDYKNIWRGVYSYRDLGDGKVEKTSMEDNIIGGEFNPEKKSVEVVNRYGSEERFSGYKLNDAGEWVLTGESVRYYMEPYNWYLGYESFSYNSEGEPTIIGKEEFIYADDFDPEAGYQTPIQGKHWRGTADGLVLKQIDTFTWGPRDVMTSYLTENCFSGTPVKEMGWEVEYDFAADCSKIFMWPDANKGKPFYENKTLKVYEYYNTGAGSGASTEWNPAISSVSEYFYSERKESGIEETVVSPDRYEVERYDLLGRRLCQPTSGINVVIYSDGTVEKVMVRK